jgi:hypothetical protein
MEHESVLFERMQNADKSDIHDASKEIAEMLRKRSQDTYPALLGVMLKTIAQFVEAGPDSRDAIHTALIGIDEDTYAKIDFEFVSAEELLAPSSEALH